MSGVTNLLGSGLALVVRKALADALTLGADMLAGLAELVRITVPDTPAGPQQPQS